MTWPRLFPPALSLALAAGCFTEIAVVVPADGGVADEGPLDQGPPDGGPPDEGPLDQGPPDEGPPDEGPLDQGPPDMGEPSCEGFSEVPLLCLDRQESRPGAEVTIPIRLALPRTCEGTGSLSGVITVGEAFTLVNPSVDGCVLSTQDGTDIIWRRPSREQAEGCSPIYVPGVQDTLRLRVDAELPPGAYDLTWSSVLIGDPITPETCRGSASLDGVVLVE
ncbi:MAG: hypothetical protein ACFCGT_00575 [Sandaracinaceae bacterium]